MFTTIRRIANDEKWIETLFMILILTFPFGSFFLSFSIGFMTVYPFLILLAAMSFLSFFRAHKSVSPLERYYLIFLCAFLIYGLVFLPFVDSKTHAASDIRSLVLMLMTGWVFIAVERVLGYEKWRLAILVTFKFIFFLVVSFAVFEVVSSFHFSGVFTEKILERGIRDYYSVTPVFLWDNPNNLASYVFLIGMVILLLEPPSPKKPVLSWLILFIWFIVSYITLSRIGLVVTLIAVPVVIYNQVRMYLQQGLAVFRKYLPYALLLVGIFLVVFISKQKFFGIPVEQERIYQNTILKTELSDDSADLLVFPSLVDTVMHPIPTFSSAIDNSKRNSESERMALIKNGIDFFVQSRYLGVGPGQFRYLHETDQIQYNTFGNNGAHFWFIEIISQYGLVIFIPYCILLIWLFGIALKSVRKEPEISSNLLFGLFCFTAVSIMPSAFLILDINWIFMAVLVIVCAHLSNRTVTNPS